MRKRAVFFSSICFIFFLACASPEKSFAVGDRERGYVPRPVLIYPVSGDVGISGPEGVSFRWSPHEGGPVGRRGYDLRLYKGNDMVEKNLVFKKMAGPRESSISISKEYFEPGGQYTWSLRLIYDNRAKSDRSYARFRAV
jgi:hypothetical protein